MYRYIARKGTYLYPTFYVDFYVSQLTGKESSHKERELTDNMNTSESTQSNTTNNASGHVIDLIGEGLGSNTTKLGTHGKDNHHKEIKSIIIVHVGDKLDM